MNSSQPGTSDSTAPDAWVAPPFGPQRMLERGFAYMMASQIIEGSCRPVGPLGEDWWDVDDSVQAAVEDLKDAVTYLDNRGLLERHPLNLNWVSLRDESEESAHA